MAIPKDELNARRRERYANDPEYRAKKLAYTNRYRLANQEKIKAQKANWYQQNKDEVMVDERRIMNARKYHLKKTYGMTVDEYMDLYEAQEGKCAVCGTTEPGGRFKNFAVDHDHVTGHNRGLLCYTCNVALGLLKEDPDTMRALLSYTESHATSEEGTK